MQKHAENEMNDGRNAPPNGMHGTVRVKADHVASADEIEHYYRTEAIKYAVLRKIPNLSTAWTERVGDYKVNVCRRALEYLMRVGMPGQSLEWAAILDANGFSTIAWRVIMLTTYKWVGLGSPGMGTVVNEIFIEWLRACCADQKVKEVHRVRLSESAACSRARALLLTAVKMVASVPKNSDVDACVMVKTTQEPSLSVQEWEMRSGAHVRFFKTIKETVVNVLPPALRRAGLNLLSALMYGDEELATTSVERLFVWGAPVLAWHLIGSAARTNHRMTELVPVQRECEDAWYLQHGDRELPVFGWMNERAALVRTTLPFAEWNGEACDMWHSGSYTVMFCVLFLVRVGYGMEPGARDWVQPVRQCRHYFEVSERDATAIYDSLHRLDPSAPREAFVGEPGGMQGVEREKRSRRNGRGQGAAVERARRRQSRYEEVDEAGEAHVEDDPIFGTIGMWTVEDVKTYLAMRMPLQEIKDAAWEAVLQDNYVQRQTTAFESMMRIVPGTDVMGIRPYLRGLRSRLLDARRDSPPPHTLTASRREQLPTGMLTCRDKPDRLEPEKLRYLMDALARDPGAGIDPAEDGALEVDLKTRKVEELLQGIEEAATFAGRRSASAEVGGPMPKRLRLDRAAAPTSIPLIGLQAQARFFSPAGKAYEGVLPPIVKKNADAGGSSLPTQSMTMVCGPVEEEHVAGLAMLAQVRQHFIDAAEGSNALWPCSISFAEVASENNHARAPGVRYVGENGLELVGMPHGQYVVREWTRKFDAKGVAYLTQGSYDSMVQMYGLGHSSLENLFVNAPQVAWQAMAFYWVWGRGPKLSNTAQEDVWRVQWLVYWPGATAGPIRAARTDEPLFLSTGRDSPYRTLGADESEEDLRARLAGIATDYAQTRRAPREVLKTWRTLPRASFQRVAAAWKTAFDARHGARLRRAAKNPDMLQNPVFARTAQAQRRLHDLADLTRENTAPDAFLKLCLWLIAANL